jgi:predicted nucleic acid-binding protein
MRRKARDYIRCNPKEQEVLPSPFPGDPKAPGIVLDTNVALDWLLFKDPSVAALADAVASGRLQWLATAAMRDELAHVLTRGLAAARRADPHAILETWDAHAFIVVEAPAQRLQCTDPDDQKFLDLAVAAGARWLVSRDRALLKLHRRAALQGLTIVPPARWRLADG